MNDDEGVPGEARFRCGSLTLAVYAIGRSLYADVYAEGQDESLYTLRLEEGCRHDDLDTLTVYDARDDEGEEVWRALPAQPITPDPGEPFLRGEKFDPQGPPPEDWNGKEPLR